MMNFTKRNLIALFALTFALTIGCFTCSTPATAQVIPESKVDKGKDRAGWMDEAKYGMFIHWGVYSIPANGEWVMCQTRTPVAKYKKMAAEFNPVKFDAEQWVAAAKNAGMRYITITSKHHDGFAMFKSEAYDYNIVDYTPFKRDVIKELKEACDKADIKLGLYYSHSQDWEFPGGEGRKWDKAQRGDFRKYLDEKALPQLREIMTQYDPATVWFDTPHGMTPSLAREFEEIVREINPNTLVNSRLIHKPKNIPGMKKKQLDEMVDLGVDFLSYRDRTVPQSSPWEYWETCMTLNGAWGYKKGDNNWKSPKEVIMLLTEVVSKGGTLLLNVGPTAEGVIPEPSVECLKLAGDWLKVNGESIYGARPTIFEGKGDFVKRTAAEQKALDKEARATGAGKRKKEEKQKEYSWLATGRQGKLYLHFFEWPTKPFVLEGFDKDKVTGSYFLADAEKSPVAFTQEAGKVTITLPAEPIDELNTVLCLELGN